MTNDFTTKDLSGLAYAIASQYVESPDKLRVISERRGPKWIVRFPGRHSKVDHGRLIGGQGKNFRALKRILQEAVKPAPLDLEIIDPGGEYVRGGEVPMDQNWKKDELFRGVLEIICEQVFGWPVPVRVANVDDSVHHVVPAHRTYLTLELSDIHPEVLAAFQVLWKAIGRHHGRNFILAAEAPKAQAV